MNKTRRLAQYATKDFSTGHHFMDLTGCDSVYYPVIHSIWSKKYRFGYDLECYLSL